jgi:CIC family chloride channel protein
MRLGLSTIAGGFAEKVSARARAALWGQTRRWFRMQGRLRSNEPTQIFVCAVFGAVIGAMVAGLHKLVDLGHELAFNISGGHTLSTGLGTDMERVLYVPVIGGLLLGLSAMIMRYFGAREIVDPVEANALHGGRMSGRDSTRLVVDTLISNVAGVAVGMEAGYSQLGASVLSKVGQYRSRARSTASS